VGAQLRDLFVWEIDLPGLTFGQLTPGEQTKSKSDTTGPVAEMADATATKLAKVVKK
jgi:hypothetical protein